MQVKTSVQGTYQFGPMGWCQIDTDQCSRMHTPYPISEVLRNATRYMKLGDEFSQRTSQLTLMLISASEWTRWLPTAEAPRDREKTH
jgi:hypothetical protein